MNGMIHFATTHFSEYVIIYDEAEANETNEPEVIEPTVEEKVNALLVLSQKTVKKTSISCKLNKVADASYYEVNVLQR